MSKTEIPEDIAALEHPDAGPGIRRWCPQKRSPARAIRFVIVTGLPVEVSEQLDDPLLFSTGNELFQGLGDGGFLVRSPLSAEARSITSCLQRW